MKLLFDQNISYRILKNLSSNFNGSSQVRELGLENCSDRQTWKYAKLNGFTIVTYDADFKDIAILKGYPPKIIWLRTGNLETKDLAELLTYKFLLINNFIENEENENWACLEIKK